MSKKSDQYRKAVDKIHHKLIQEELGDFETKIKSYGNRNIQAPKNATLVASVKLTELKKEEVQGVFYEMIEQEFEHDSAMEYFQAGGGCIQKEVVLINQKQLPDDESIPALEIEDERKEYGFDEFLSDIFGGNVSLATAPARYVGFGF